MILDFSKLFLFTTEIETEIENKTKIKNSYESKAFYTFIITKKAPICWILAILIVYGLIFRFRSCSYFEHTKFVVQILDMV